MILTCDNLDALNQLRDETICSPVQWIADNYSLANIRPSQVLKMIDSFGLSDADINALAKKLKKDRGIVVTKAHTSNFKHPEFILRKGDNPLCIQKQNNIWNISFSEEYGFLYSGKQKEKFTFVSKTLYATPSKEENLGLLVFETNTKELEKELRRYFGMTPSIDGGFVYEAEIPEHMVEIKTIKFNVTVGDDILSYPAIQVTL